VAAKGNQVFPFHLGDINMPTPANVVEAMNRAIGRRQDRLLRRRRDRTAAPGAGRRRFHAPRTCLRPRQRRREPGGKPVIGKFLQVVMNPGDAVLYPSPGYPIYESQIDYFGGIGQPYRYAQTQSGFAIDLDQVRSLITPATKVLI